jgi:hypothetical protein
VLEALLVRGGLKPSDARTTLATRLPPRGVLMLDNPAGAAALALGGKRAARRRAVAAASLARRQRKRTMPPAPPPVAAGARRAAFGPNALSSRLLPRAKRIEALAAAGGGDSGSNSSISTKEKKDPLKRALIKAAAEGDLALTSAVQQIERQWRDYAAHLLWGGGGGGGGAWAGATAAAAPQTTPAPPASLMARLDLHGARVRVESARNRALEGREGVVLRASWRALLIAEDAAALTARRQAKAAAAAAAAKQPAAARRPPRSLRISCVPRAGSVFSLLLPTPAAAAAPAPAPKRALIGGGAGGGGSGGSTEPFYWREGLAGEALPRPARGGGG